MEIHGIKEQAQVLIQKCPSAHRIPGDIVRLSEKYDQLCSHSLVHITYFLF